MPSTEAFTSSSAPTGSSAAKGGSGIINLPSYLGFGFFFSVTKQTEREEKRGKGGGRRNLKDLGWHLGGEEENEGSIISILRFFFFLYFFR